MQVKQMKRIPRILGVLVVALVATMLLSGVAFAYPTVNLNEVKVDPKQDVGIYTPVSGIGNVLAETGAYNLFLSGSGYSPQTVKGFCVEMAYSTDTPMQFELVPIPLLGANLKMAAWIDANYLSSFPVEGQIAAWEASTDGLSFNFYSGNFQLQASSGLSAGQIAKATAIYYEAFDAVNNHGYIGSGFVWANSPPGSIVPEFPQGYVFGDPVPIPGTAWLLGSGLIGLAGLKKKGWFYGEAKP